MAISKGLAASVIKLPIMLEAMYQVKDGRGSFNDMLPLRKEDQVSGSGVLRLFHTSAEINFETAIVFDDHAERQYGRERGFQRGVSVDGMRQG